MELKQAIQELKNLVFSSEFNDIDIEKYVENLAEQCDIVSVEDLINIYNNMYLWKTQSAQPKFVRGNPVWSNGEKEVLYTVTLLAKNERPDLNADDIFENMVDIFHGRTIGSIRLQYYQIRRDKLGKNDHMVKDSKTKYNEAIKLLNNNKEEEITEEITNVKDNDEEINLIDTAVELINNVDKVGLDINTFFVGMLNLSRKAVENNNVEKIENLELELRKERSRNNLLQNKNDQLQNEFSKLYYEFDKLKNEIEHFNGLSSKEKLQNLKKYNSRLQYMVDQFGGIVISDIV